MNKALIFALGTYLAIHLVGFSLVYLLSVACQFKVIAPGLTVYVFLALVQSPRGVRELYQKFNSPT